MPLPLSYRLIKANKKQRELARGNWRLFAGHIANGLLPNSFLSCTPKLFSMEYSRIVAVTGMPGLYEIVSSKSDGAIVRSLEDGSTRFVSSRVHNLSHLESIEIYTTGDNVTLADVFTAIKNNSEAKPDLKDNKALKAYFEKVYPDLDFDRVYTSDMKKMVTWAGVLEKHNVDFTPKEASQDEENEGENNAAQTLEAAGEKVTMEVTPDAVPEVAETKTTKSRKKKSEE